MASFRFLTVSPNSSSDSYVSISTLDSSPFLKLATAASICATGSVMESVITLPIKVVATAIAIPAAHITIKIITVHTLAACLELSSSTWNSSLSVLNRFLNDVYFSYALPIIIADASACFPAVLSRIISSENDL